MNSDTAPAYIMAMPIAMATAGDTASLQHLLSEGLDPNMADAYGCTLLTHASKALQAEVVVLLLRAQGCDPDLADLQGRTALHEACSQGDAGAVRALLAAGADANLRDVHGNTPLMLAVNAHCEPGVVSVLSRVATLDVCAVNLFLLHAHDLAESHGADAVQLLGDIADVELAEQHRSQVIEGERGCCGHGGGGTALHAGN